jgi:hypothetical protein
MERAGKPRHRWQDPTDEGESADSARVRAFGVGALARECSELGVGFPPISAFENPGRLLANSFGVASHPLRQLVSFRQVLPRHSISLLRPVRRLEGLAVTKLPYSELYISHVPLQLRMILRVLCFENATMRQPNVKDEWVMRIERDV